MNVRNPFFLFCLSQKKTVTNNWGKGEVQPCHGGLTGILFVHILFLLQKVERAHSEDKNADAARVNHLLVIA